MFSKYQIKRVKYSLAIALAIPAISAIFYLISFVLHLLQWEHSSVSLVFLSFSSSVNIQLYEEN